MIKKFHKLFKKAVYCSSFFLMLIKFIFVILIVLNHTNYVSAKISLLDLFYIVVLICLIERLIKFLFKANQTNSIK